MHPALRLLIWLRAKSLVRNIKRAASTPRGLFLTIVALLGIGSFISSIGFSMLAGRAVNSEIAGNYENYFAFLLLAYLIITLVSSFSSEGIYFSEAEIENLFPAPFSRRQLLMYNLFSVFRQAAVLSLFCLFGFSMVLQHWICGIIGIFLAYLFSKLVPILLTLVGQLGQTQLYDRRRKIAAFTLLTIIAVAVVSKIKTYPFENFSREQFDGWLATVSSEAPGSIILAPFKVFARVMFYERLDLTFWGWAAIAGLINLALVGLIMLLDANYLEAAERASRKLVARRKRIHNSGGTVAKTKEQFKWSLPMPARMAGVGPLIWRQSLTTIRLGKNVFLVCAIIMIAIGTILMLNEDQPALQNQNLAGLLIGGSAYLTLLFSMMAPVGFAADIQRMEVFKSLPISDSIIVFGQIIGSVGIISFAQITLFLFGLIVNSSLASVWIVAILLVLPYNYLFLCTKNCVLLLFPIQTKNKSSLLATGYVFLAMSIMLSVIGFAIGTTFMLSALMFLLSGSLILSGILAAVLLGLYGFLLTLALTWCYRRFDVSLDTPTT